MVDLDDDTRKVIIGIIIFAIGVFLIYLGSLVPPQAVYFDVVGGICIIGGIILMIRPFREAIGL